MLYVRFDGPASLGKVRVRFTVRDDFDRSRVPPLAGGPTPEQIAGTIWPHATTSRLPQHSEAHPNWALITMMTRRLTRKNPRTSQWTHKTPTAS